MKVFGIPDELQPIPKFQPNDTVEGYFARIDAHKEKLRQWLKEAGYTKPLTGKTVSFAMGDGAAEYMVAEGHTTMLIHLPYGDGYSYPHVQHLPKSAIVAQIKSQENMAAIFAKRDKQVEAF